MAETKLRARRSLIVAALAGLLLCVVALSGARRSPPVVRENDLGAGAVDAVRANAQASTPPRERARPAGSATPRTQTLEVELHSKMYALVGSLAHEVRAALPAHPDFAEFTACSASQGRPSARCQTVIADVINYAVFNSGIKMRIAEDRLEMTASLPPDAWPVAAELLAETTATSQDPLERISALMLMRLHPKLEYLASEPLLPEAAYRDLDQRPLTEARLLAERHRGEPLSGTRVSEFVRLAQSTDTRAQAAALLALGHPQTAAQLHEVALTLPITRATWTDLANAAGKCGLPCTPTVEYLLAEGPSGARMAVYDALGLAPDDDRKPLAELALAHVPKTLDEQEQTAREQLLRDALAD